LELSNKSTGSFYQVVLSGLVGLAAAYSAPGTTGIWNTTDGGQTWTNNAYLQAQDFNSVAIDGTIALASNYSATASAGTGIHRSTDSGQTWTQVLGNLVIQYIYLSGTNAVAVSSLAGGGIWWSNNSGLTWTQSTNTAGGVMNGSFYNVDFNGSNGVAGSNVSSNSGLWYSTNLGQSWTQVALVNSGTFYSVRISGTNAIAASNAIGMWYSTNSGQNWTQSDVTVGTFLQAFLLNNIGITGGVAGGQNGIWVTGNAGQTWTKSSSTTGTFRSVYIVGSNGLAGSSTTQGVWINTSPLCYGENTRILCLIDEEEKYVNISDITVGTLVKTYKFGYKPVKYINSFNHFTFSSLNPIDSIYKMNDSDLIITGGHSILVDELTEEESDKIIKYNFSNTILDKKLLLACCSDKFTLLDNFGEVIKLFHIVLENDNINDHYGIYVNDDILSESCSEFAFLNFLKNNEKKNSSEEIEENKSEEIEENKSEEIQENKSEEIVENKSEE